MGIQRKDGMTLDSSNDTVAILYDIENAPFEMLNYTLSKAERYQPCRTIVISDWDARPEQKRWEKLMRRPGFTFRQISRTFFGKNSLDSALYDSAKLLYQEGVRKFFIITTDSDFVRIAQSLNEDTPSYIIGVGTKQASETLRSAYNEFFVYPPEDDVKKEAKNVKEKPVKAAKAQEEKAKAAAKDSKDKKAKSGQEKSVKERKLKENKQGAKENAPKDKKIKEKQNAEKPVKENTAKKVVKPVAKQAEEKPTQAVDGTLAVRIPKSLRKALEERRQEEGVSLDELVTYILMRGLH